MAKNWTFTLLTSSQVISITETSMSPTSSTIFAGPIGQTQIAYSRTNQYDIPGHNYFIIRSGNNFAEKIDYNGDTLSPATGSNTVLQYINRLCNLLNGGSF